MLFEWFSSLMTSFPQCLVCNGSSKNHPINVVTRVVWLSKTFVALLTNLLSPISTKIVPLLLFTWCLLLYFDWPPWLIVVYFNFNMGERKYHIYTSTTYLNHLLANRMQHTMAMVLLFYKTTTMVALELCTSNVRVAQHEERMADCCIF